MIRKKIKGPLLLFLAAAIWGTAFVAQDVASDTVPPFAFNGVRMLLGAFTLLVVVLLRGHGAFFPKHFSRAQKRKSLCNGALCGLILFSASSFQQVGITLGTGAGKSGFLTALYIVFVPLFGLFQKKKPRKTTWLAVLAALAGLYFLCMASFDRGFSDILENFAFSRGDLCLIACAVLFSFHILTIARVAPTEDGVRLSCIQFFVAGLLSLGVMFVFEQPTLSAITDHAGAILYSGILSCAIAYTLQIIGQKTTAPAFASLLLCLESVFAVLGDMIILKTKLTPEEICGCILLFFAILIATLSDTATPHKLRRTK